MKRPRRGESMTANSRRVPLDSADELHGSPGSAASAPASEAATMAAPTDTTDLEYIAEPLRTLAVPCDKSLLDPINARRHPEANLEAIKASLRVYGQRKPVVVNRRTGAIEAGNGTLQAASELRWSHLAV